MGKKPLDGTGKIWRECKESAAGRQGAINVIVELRWRYDEPNDAVAIFDQWDRVVMWIDRRGANCIDWVSQEQVDAIRAEVWNDRQPKAKR